MMNGNDKHTTEPLIITSPRTKTWERSSNSPGAAAAHQLQLQDEAALTPTMSETNGFAQRQNETNGDLLLWNSSTDNDDGQSLLLSSTKEEDEDKERELSLVVLKILGTPYASTFQFWCIQLPVACLLGAVVGLLTLGFLVCVHVLLNVWFPSIPKNNEMQHIMEGKFWYIFIGTFGGLLSASVLLLPGAPRLGTTRTMFHDAVNPTLEGTTVKETTWLVLSSLMALSCGAPLGPEAAAGAIGSGVAMLFSKIVHKNNNSVLETKRTRVAWVMAGMAASLGGLFPTPLLGVLIVHELSIVGRPNRYSLTATAAMGSNDNDEDISVRQEEDSDYMEQLFLSGSAATTAFLVIRLLVGPHSLLSQFGNDKENPIFDSDEFQLWHLAAAIPLGIVCGFLGTLVLIVNGVCRSLRQAACRVLARRFGAPQWVGQLLFPIVAGLLCGLCAYWNPLTVGTGMPLVQPLLKAYMEKQSFLLKPHQLILAAVTKALLMAICLGFGLVGGPVFPLVFVGLLLGLAFLPTIPISVAVPCCMAAMPGSFVAIPFTLVLFIVMIFQLTAEQVGPVLVATLVSYTVVGGLGIVKKLGLKRLNVEDEAIAVRSLSPVERESSFMEQQVPPNDDDILKSIRTAIFGETIDV